MRRVFIVASLSLLVPALALGNTVASSTMQFQGALTDNGDGTYTGVVPMIVGGVFDVYAEEGATAQFGDDPGGGPVWTPQVIVSHDAWPTWNPDTQDWYQYSIEFYVDGSVQKWALRNHPGATATNPWYDEVFWGAGGAPPAGVPMSGFMSWGTLYAEETDVGAYLSGTGTPEIPGGAATQGGGPQAWDMDWSWGSEMVPLEYPGFDVSVVFNGTDFDVTLTPAPIPVNNTIIDASPATSGPLACGVPVTLTFSLTTDDYTPDVFGYNVVVRASSEVTFGTITDLQVFGSTTYFFTMDNGDGSWDISASTIGSPSQPITTAGTHGLFTIEFIPATDGTAAITYDVLKVRDPNNVPIPVVGTGASIEVDCTAPAAVTGITAAPGHNKVDVTWTHDGTDVDHYEMFSGLWYDSTPGTSAYPEYDDLPGNVIPTPPADYTTAVGSAEWVAVTPSALVTNQTQSWPDHLSRGVYYYTVFAVDAAGNVSSAPAAVDRATNYWLGDVTGVPSGAPNGEVQSYDMNVLGATYGKDDGDVGYDNEADVGPTDDTSRVGIPTTDDTTDFEDLMVFAMNFGVATPAKEKLPISPVVDLAWVRYDDGRQALRLVGGTGVKGLNVRADTGVSGVVAGDLLDSQSDLTFLRNVGENLDVGVAITGVNVGFVGSGDLFVVDAESEITFEDLTIKVRGYDNSELKFNMGETTGSLTPRVFTLNPNYPNPFNPMTKISFSLPEAQPVRLEIYGLDGRKVATLLNESRGPGLHEVIWNGQDDSGRQAASGMYFYRIDAGPYSEVRKMTLMK